MSKPLTPPDPKQCQAEKPNGDTFMTLGGRPGGRVRCTEYPAVVVTEKEPGPDGQRGSMSLCGECLVVALTQLPNGSFIVKNVETPVDNPIRPTEEQKREASAFSAWVNAPPMQQLPRRKR